MRTLYSLLLLLCLHSFYFGLFGYLEKTVQQSKPTIEIYFSYLLDSEQSHTLPPLLTVSEELFRSLLVCSLKYSWACWKMSSKIHVWMHFLNLLHEPLPKQQPWFGHEHLPWSSPTFPPPPFCDATSRILPTDNWAVFRSGERGRRGPAGVGVPTQAGWNPQSCSL